MILEDNEKAVSRMRGDNSTKSYLDEYGRIELGLRTKSKRGRFSHENPKTFQGYMDIVLDHAGKFTDSRKQITLDAIKMTEVEPGLFGRQVPGQNFGNTVSHDEYNGICYTASVVPELRETVCNEIVEYGMKHGKFGLLGPYNDEKPGLTLVECLKNKEHRKDLAFVRQPRDSAFYKIMSTKYEASWFELLFMAISSIITAHRPAFHRDCGTKLIMFFRILAIEKVTNKWYLRLLHVYIRRKLAKTYGSQYLAKMLRAYFKDSHHPIHTLSKGLE